MKLKNSFQITKTKRKHKKYGYNKNSFKECRFVSNYLQ